MKTGWLPSNAHVDLALTAAGMVGLGLGLVSVWISPVIGLVAIGGVMGGALVVRRPEIGLVAIMAITGLVNTETLPTASMGPISLHITDVILLALLALILLHWLNGRAPVRTPIDLALLLFYIAVVVAATRAITWYGVAPNFVLRRLRPLTYYLAFFAVTNLVRTRSQLILLTNGLFLVALVAALAITLQVMFPGLEIVQTRSVQLTTAGRTYTSVNRTYSYAEWLVYSMFLVSVCSIALGSPWLSTNLETLRAFALGTGVFLSYQRNYWMTMGLMLCFLVLILTWSARFRLVRLGAAAGLTVLVIFNLPITGPEQYIDAAVERVAWGLSPSTLSQDGSAQMRVFENTYALRSIERRPVLGIGLGNAYRPRLERDVNPLQAEPTVGLQWYMHNAYLWIWVQMGLVALLPFLGVLIAVVWRGLTRWRNLSDPQLRVMVLGFTLGVLGQALSDIVAPNFIQSWALIAFAIMWGSSEVAYRLAAQESSAL